ncbi:uncharacterized protein LOC118458836 isoform X2 [Anopheles albimanus]|uniref:uncharacterized protein LOC118458836 isoform X2 n=1 Tax=Anopheles albimanus TaxID=7167 RepID=UPI00163DFA98|nr:uncharacterized protein LOC118458836 isoform X2 [Anopheles albimanus]
MSLLEIGPENREFWCDFIELYRNLPVLWAKPCEGEPKSISKNLRNRAHAILLRKYRELDPTAVPATIKNVLKQLQYLCRAAQPSQTTETRNIPTWLLQSLDFLLAEEQSDQPLSKRSTARENDSMPSIKEPGDESVEFMDPAELRNDLQLYCKSLERELRMLPEPQLQYAQTHIESIVRGGQLGILSSEWPQTDPSVEEVRSDMPEPPEGVVEECIVVHLSATDPDTVKRRKLTDAVQWRDIESSDHHSSGSARNDRESEAVGSDNDILCSQDYRDDYAIIETDNVEYQMEDSRNSFGNDEIVKSNDPTATIDDSNFIAVRLPSGLVLRRRCTAHCSNFVDSIVPEYSESEFVRQFRMGRETVRRLCDHLEQENAFKKLNGHGGYVAISVETHVLAFLWFLGQKKVSYRNVAEQFQLSLSCVHDVIWRVCDGLLNLEPTGFKQLDDTAKALSACQFGEHCSIPNVIGCVDGMQIRIDRPSENSGYYQLSKRYYTLQLQAIIDADMRFMNVFADYPGEPDLLEAVVELCGDKYCVLGNQAFPCLPQLLVPFPSDGLPLTIAQQSFNDQLAQAHTAYQKVFQRLLQRFRQLSYLKGCQLSKVVKMVKVCCLLHNLAVPEELDLFEDDPSENSYVQTTPFFTRSSVSSTINVQRGQQKRKAICAEL